MPLALSRQNMGRSSPKTFSEETAESRAKPMKNMWRLPEQVGWEVGREVGEVEF